MRTLTWTFVAASAAGSAAMAAVVPSLPLNSPVAMRAVAGRVQPLVVAVRSQALFAIGARGGPSEQYEAVSEASGVLVGEGLVVTTLHAVALPGSDGQPRPVSEVQVVVAGLAAFPARVAALEPVLGLAVLELSGPTEHLGGAALARLPAGAGDALIAVACLGDRWSAVEAAVEDGGPLRLRTAAPLDSRFWGAPLFNREGELAGLLTPDARGQTALIAADLIRALLEAHAGSVPE